MIGKYVNINQILISLGVGIVIGAVFKSLLYLGVVLLAMGFGAFMYVKAKRSKG